MDLMNSALAISPLDGRYGTRLRELGQYFSEYALMRARCRVEMLYVLALDKTGLFEPLLADEKERINDCLHNFSDEDYLEIKAVERETRHDLKACEIFLRARLQLRNEHLIHFALTSDDINNLAYSSMLDDYRRGAQQELHKELLMKLTGLASQWQQQAFPAYTHGQKASPTTAGKELAVFANRLLRQLKKLESYRFRAKLNGAVGNYSAMKAAFPDFDWIGFSNAFIRDLGFEPNIATTQIEDQDSWAAYFNICRQINNVVMDLDLDCWQYISKGLFKEKSSKNEVGSSTMPHKVNPINFENSEGNLALSNAMLTILSDRLCRSRMQRDLSDSTVKRNLGVALAHSFLAIRETIKGLGKLQLDEQLCRDILASSPELLAEPIQTILKLHGVEDPYNLLKEHTRGKQIERQDLVSFIEALDLSRENKEKLLSLRTIDYVGDAAKVASTVVAEVEKFCREGFA